MEKFVKNAFFEMNICAAIFFSPRAERIR